MKRLLLSLVFIGALAVNAMAGNGDNNNTSSSSTKILCGKVTDKSTGEVLAGVKIKVKGTNTFCYTDLKGNFILTISASEKADVAAEMIGYEPITIPSDKLGFNSEIALTER